MLRPSLLALASTAVALASCAPRARMCTTQPECGGGDVACVAGRCQPDKPNVKPAIDSARRFVVHPVDMAFVRRGDGDGALPATFTLGRESAALLLRFAVALPATTTVVEAYVVLRRSDAVDDDPAPIALHATRIVEAWTGRSTSWARLPRTQETRTPSTTVEPAGPSLVRLDVRDLVRQWARRDPRDQGIAVVAENGSRTGMTFALTEAGSDRGDQARSASAPDVEPYLELYVR